MTALLVSEATGGAMVMLVLIGIAIPYAVRGRWLAPSVWGVGYLPRLAPHYWIGFTVAGLSLVHASFAMAAPLPRGSGSPTGIWVATGAMLLTFGQVMLGNQLRSLRGRRRLRLRRAHFLVMGGLVVAGALHVWLDGPVVQSIVAQLGG